MEKTVAELIDDLIVVNLKVYHLNDIAELEKDDHKVAEASRKMVKLMAKRSQLRNAIGERLKDPFGEVKQYG